MSKQQTGTTSACPHPEAVGTRWGDPISEERQVELQGYLDRWAAEADHRARIGPFDKLMPGDVFGVSLTGADAFWLANQTRDVSGHAPSLRLDGANFHSAHLEGANLNAAHLEGVFLSRAHLEGANLIRVWLIARRSCAMLLSIEIPDLVTSTGMVLGPSTLQASTGLQSLSSAMNKIQALVQKWKTLRE